MVAAVLVCRNGEPVSPTRYPRAFRNSPTRTRHWSPMARGVLPRNFLEAATPVVIHSPRFLLVV